MEFHSQLAAVKADVQFISKENSSGNTAKTSCQIILLRELVKTLP